MVFYTYIFRNPETLIPFYVGKGSRDRVFRHRSNRGTAVYEAIQELQSRGLQPSVEIIDALDEEHAFFLERCLIDMFGRLDLGTGTLLNKTAGGQGQTKPSAETRRKMSEGKKGAVFSDEHRHRISMAGFGRKVSDDTRKKQSRAASRPRPDVSAALLGRPKSAEHKAKIAAARKRYWAERRATAK